MNRRITRYTSRLRPAVLTMGAALLLSGAACAAENARDAYVPSLLPPAAHVDQSVLNRRLRSARSDMEAYRAFAENFRSSGNAKALAQLQHPVDDFLKRHVEGLLAQCTEHADIETTRLTAETMFIESRLFMSLGRREAAQNAIADMKRRFSEYRKMPVELPGTRTTLDAAIKKLDEEWAATAAQAKEK